MYNNNKASTFDNSITVTPIKVEMNMSPAYPTLNSTGNSVAVAATTTSARRNTQMTQQQQQQQQQQQANTVNMIPIPNSTATISFPFNSNTSCTQTQTVPKEKNVGTVSTSTKAARTYQARKPPPTIDNFWPNVMSEVRSIQQVDAKHQALPLARIKKIMKLDENAKMIAAEAPLLFAKACEYFIQELSMRAWIHTEESKRRTLQRSDIAQAIANYDQFDFLIDIVPREDIKPSPSSHKRVSEGATQSTGSGSTDTTSTPPTTSNNTNNSSQQANSTVVKMEPTDQIISYGTLATTDQIMTNNVAVLQQQQNQQQQQQQQQQQHQVATSQPQPQQHQQLQIIQQTAAAHPQQLQYFITIPGQQVGGQHNLVQQLQLQQQQLPNGLTPQLTGLNLAVAQPQQLILTAGPNGQLTATPAPTAQQQQQTALLQNLAAQQQQQQQQQQVHHQQQQQQNQHIQLLQQVVTPTGEITNVPVNINNSLSTFRTDINFRRIN